MYYLIVSGFLLLVFFKLQKIVNEFLLIILNIFTLFLLSIKVIINIDKGYFFYRKNELVKILGQIDIFVCFLLECFVKSDLGISKLFYFDFRC